MGVAALRATGGVNGHVHDCARTRVWSLIRKRNRTAEEKETIVQANVEMEAATKEVRRLLERRPARDEQIEHLRAECAARKIRTESVK